MLLQAQALDAQAIDDEQSANPAAEVDTSEAENPWEAEKRRLAKMASEEKGDLSRQRADAGRRTGRKRKKKKGWLSLMGVGGDDEKGEPKPLKLPKLSLEEVITGMIVIAIGGLFVSFVI